MSFMREEARAGLWRWREVLAGIGLMVLGAAWVLRSLGLLYWLGFVLLAAGAALVAVGVPRARFRGTGGGPGVVQIVEGRVSYFGPLTGGVLDLSEITRLVHDTTGHPAHWELSAPGQPPLHIPVSASGAEALFDAFQSLPGLSTARLMVARGQTEGRQVVWQRA